MVKRLGALNDALDGLDAVDDGEVEKRAKRRTVGVFDDRQNLAVQAAAGRMRSAAIRSVPPGACRMWRRHNRFYHLLTPENCAELIDDIRAKGQQTTPAIVRPLRDDPEGFEYEVIAGARRHFAVTYLREQEKREDLFYLVEVRRIADEEAFLASDAENRGRADISEYERARDYASALAEFYDGNVLRMSEKISISRGTLRHYLNLANLPEAVVAAYPRATDIPLRNATQLTPLLNDPAARGRIEARAEEIANEQASARERGDASAYDARAVHAQLLDAGRAAPIKTAKRKPASETVRNAEGRTILEVENGRKYLTFRVALANTPPTREVLTEIRKRLPKSGE